MRFSIGSQNFCGATPSNYGMYTRSTGGYGGGPGGDDPKLEKAIWSHSSSSL